MMRKYAQLGLVIICVLSIGGLLVMERRYSHMKVFLEVADMFQTSDAKLKCHQQLESLRTQLERTYLALTHSVEPSWKQTALSGFIYTAFYSPHDAKVTLLMVAPTKPGACRLWLDQRTVIDVVATVSVLASTNDHWAMAVHCSNTNVTTTPLMVEVSGVSLPIEVLAAPASTLSISENVAVCVRPLNISSADEIELAEFMTYYNRLGVANFYVYDEGLPTNVKTFVKRAGFIQTSLNSQLIQWNVPVSVDESLMEAILKADCLLRSGLTSKYVAVLKLNEYFVIRRDQFNMTSLLAAVLQPGQVLAVHERLFCDEFPDDVIASALNYPFVTLRKTRFSRNDKQHRIVIVHAGSLVLLKRLLRGGMSYAGTSHISYLSEESAHLNVYTSCKHMHFWLRKNNLLQQLQQENKASFVDIQLTKLHEALFGSKLYKQAIHQKSSTYHLIA